MAVWMDVWTDDWVMGISIFIIIFTNSTLVRHLLFLYPVPVIVASAGPVSSPSELSGFQPFYPISVIIT